VASALPDRDALTPRPPTDTRSSQQGIRASWTRYRRQQPALIGLILLAGLLGVALLADVIAPGDTLRRAGAPLQPPSGRNWFGTDDLGRDVFAGVVHGSRPSLLIGFAAAFTSAVVGTLVGSIAGYFGRVADDVLMRLRKCVRRVIRATFQSPARTSRSWRMVPR
jgi:peptide/nickel transport system permease protein